MASLPVNQDGERNLRDSQAGGYEGFVLSSRGKYWLRAQQGLVVQSFRLHGDEAIYDAGAGIGLYTLDIAQRYPKTAILAVDFSGESILVLEARMKTLAIQNVTVLLENIITYAPQPEHYDCVLSIDVLQHLPTDAARLQAVQNFYAALKPGGHVTIVNYRWGGWIKSPKLKEEFNHGGAGLYRMAFTEADMTDLLQRGGFRKVRAFGIIRMPIKLQRFIPTWLATTIESGLNMFRIKGASAMYVLASGIK